jgi:hypothetical protein
MNKKATMTFMVLLILIISAGCTQTSEIEEPQEMPDNLSTYEIINYDDLETEELRSWHNTYFKELGQQFMNTNDEDKSIYILVSYGQVPTGGYSVELVDEYIQEEEHFFTFKMNSPSPDVMVTQVISYPYILLKVSNSDKIMPVVKREQLKIIEETVQSEVIMYEGIEGVFNGWVVGSFIEIDLHDTVTLEGLEGKFNGKTVFMMSDSAKEMIDFSEFKQVVFDFFVDENGTSVILRIESIAAQVEGTEIKAIYIGRIDSNFIEVLYKDEYHAVLLHEADEPTEMEDYFAVNIVYTVNDNNQKLIESIMVADLPRIGQAEESTMTGQVDMHPDFGMVMIDGSPYWLAFELLLLSSKRIQDFDEVTITYYHDQYGRKVITSYEKPD